MKKNRTMRVATLLMVLTLITSCFVGGTFAKYTTSSTVNDSARVAYWGFDSSAYVAIDMFDGIYTNDANETTVDSSNEDNVIAPGTSKTTQFGFGYTPKGAEVNALTAGEIAAPEVAYTFTVNAECVGDYDALDNNPNFRWTLQPDGAAQATSYATVEQLLAAIEALSGNADGVQEYGPGELPTNFDAAEKHTIGWVWDFETADDTTTADENEMNTQDAADTAMGNAQNLDDVTFTITITATQRD